MNTHVNLVSTKKETEVLTDVTAVGFLLKIEGCQILLHFHNNRLRQARCLDVKVFSENVLDIRVCMRGVYWQVNVLLIMYIP